jgi:CheY-like chemotaxis protein
MAKILIVDDDRTTADLLKMMLELDGFEVVLVWQGVHVLNAVEQHRPDLVLMDYNLHDVQGVEVLRQLRQHPLFQRLPVIIGSGMNVGAEVIQAGATDFLIKPYDPDDLTRRLRQIVK